jgi:hypothetical protein
MSESWFDGVTVTVEIAFDDVPLAAAPTWTDVTAYCRGFQTRRGRQTEFDPFSPGTASVLFSNADRRFDPEYASSPYVGKLVPMRRLRISAAYSAVTYRLFTGYVMGWPQQYTYPNDSTVTVTAVDGFRILENFRLADNAYQAAVLADAPVAYWPMQELVDGTLVDSIGDVQFLQTFTAIAGQTALDTSYIEPVLVDNGVPLGATNAVTVDDDDRPAFGFTKELVLTCPAPSGAPKALEFWVRAHPRNTDVSIRIDTDSTNLMEVTSTGSARYSNSVDNKRATPIFGANGIPTEGWVHVALYADTTNTYLRVNGAARFSEALTAGTLSPTGDSGAYRIEIGRLDSSFPADAIQLAHLAVYSTAPSAARFDAHYAAGVHAWGHPIGERSGDRIDRVLDEIGWPSALRSIPTGETVQGPYLADGETALAHIRKLEASEQGGFFVAGDGAATLVERQAVLLATSTATLSDDGSDVPYFGIEVDGNTVDAIRNEVEASYGGGSRNAKDETSIDAYGPGRDSVDASTIESAALATELARYRVRLGKDPQTRIPQVIVLPRRRPAAAFPVVLGAELMDRVTVERTPQDVGTAFSKIVTVQGVEHSSSPHGQWETTLYCSPAPQNYTEAPYLVVGDATYGKIGAADGNLVPF